jgi:hypothetical protein
MSKKEIIEVGKYRFQITTNIQTYRDQIIIHTYRIGGDYEDCINISYKYNNNKPVQAKIPHLLYEPECALGSVLEKGSGTELIIKSAIYYAYKDVPSIPIFEFEDDSHIDCVEKDISIPPPRKAVKPLNLAFFYIAYHGKTWYEARFNAKMINAEKYGKYKKSLEFLIDPAKKVSFQDFLQIIGTALTSLDKCSLLEKYYSSAKTYRDFFESIPRSKRCEMLSGWLNTFMEYYIGHIFSDKGWYIDVNTMNSGDSRLTGGMRPSSVSLLLSPKKIYRLFSYKKRSNF